MKKFMISCFLLLGSRLVLGQITNNEKITSKVEHSDSIKVKLMPSIEIQGVRAGQGYPFAQTMIDKNSILKNNIGQDIPFILNQVPGSVIHSDAGNGIGYTGIRIRGTDASRINFTINGISFNDPESQGVFLVNMPDLLSSTNNIQIQRGVGTSTNGTGAFGASVNMLTNEVREKAYLEINNSAGSFQTFKNTLKAGTGLINNRYSLDVRMSSITSKGFIERASSNLKAFYISAASIKENASLRFNIISGKEKTYQAWYGVSEDQLSINPRFNAAGLRSVGNPYENETDNYWQTHYQLFYNKKISSKWNFNGSAFTTTGRGYYEQFKEKQGFKNYGIQSPVINGTLINETDLIRQLWLDNIFYGMNLSTQFKNEKREITIGGNVSNYDAKHFGKIIWADLYIPKDFKWYDLTAHKNEQSLYGKWLEGIGNYQFFGDLQMRTVQYDLNGFRSNPSLQVTQQFTFINPKMGIRYSKNNTTGFVSYAKARKEPNRDDFEAGSAETPLPEKLDDLEAGIQKTTKKYRMGVTLYYMNYKNQLILTGKINDVGAYTRSNIPKSSRMGIEFEGSYSIQKWLHVSNNLALSRNQIKSFTEYYDDYDNGGQKINKYASTNIALSPSIVHHSTVTAILAKNTTLTWISKYVSRQYLDNTSRKDRSLNPYFINDLQFNKSFATKNRNNFSIILQVNNLFKQLYTPNGYTYSYQYGGQVVHNNFFYPMAGRNWMIALNISM